MAATIPAPAPRPATTPSLPAQPAASEFTAIPATSAGTVSQLGMRRKRQSVHPATRAGTAASIQTPCFSIGLTSPRGPRDEQNQPEVGSRGVPSKCTETRGRQGSKPASTADYDRLTQPSQREEEWRPGVPPGGTGGTPVLHPKNPKKRPDHSGLPYEQFTCLLAQRMPARPLRHDLAGVFGQ